MQLPAIIVLGVVAIGGLAFGWSASSKLDSTQQAVAAQLKATQQSVQQDMSSLKDRVAQDEKANAELQGDLKVVTGKLKITQGQLKKARKEATNPNKETMQKLSALDSSVHSELATKASSDDVKNVETKVAGVKTDLDATHEDLKMQRSELGTLIARNYDEIDSVRRTLTPQFPAHPPRWTSRIKLPDGLVVRGNGTETLGLALARIEEALRHAQISEWSVYAFDRDGFVVVCRMEAIDEHGDALPTPKRWTIDPLPPEPWHLRTYLQALFTAPQGRYRVIALVVTPSQILAEDQKGTAGELNRLLKSGAGDLPSDMKSETVEKGTRCEALLYEFYKRGLSDDARFVEQSTITPVRHLSGAMLWKSSQLQ